MPPPPNGPQSRSLSLGALASPAAKDADEATLPSIGARRDEDKRHRESEARQADTKKRKESEVTPKSSSKHVAEVDADNNFQEQDVKKKAKKKISKNDSTEKADRNKSVRKKEASPMDVDENVDEKKIAKNIENSQENISLENDATCKKKVMKKRITTSSSRDSEKLRGQKKTVGKESSEKLTPEKRSESSRESTPVVTSSVTEASRVDRAGSISSISKNDPKSSIRSPSNKSVISAISTDGTLKASDSSISTRHSVSPSKSVVEIETVINQAESKPPTPRQLTNSNSAAKTNVERKVSKVSSGAKVAKTSSAAKVYKATSEAKVSQNSSATKFDSLITGNLDGAISPPDNAIKGEVAETIQDKPTTNPLEEKIEFKAKNSEAITAANDSVSSKDSSQHSSVVSTPARSRTGSESSVEARPGRQDSNRRNSKIFTKAAMWDNMCMQQSDKPPLATEKVRKNSRSGGLNLSDISKKFEEKPPADRKKSVVGSFKVTKNEFSLSYKFKNVYFINT